MGRNGPLTSRAAFRFEKDMVGPVIGLFHELVDGVDWCVFTECSGPIGIADIVLARLNPDAILHRLEMAIPPMLNSIMAKTFSAIGRYGPLDLESLASEVGCSMGHVRARGVMPLVISGLLSFKDGLVSPCARFPQVFDRILAVELKLKHWQKGIYQARRYLRFANKVFLALDNAYRHRVDIYMDTILEQRIGLVFADASRSNAYVATDPGWHAALSDLDYAVVSERLFAAILHKASNNSATGRHEWSAATAVTAPIFEDVVARFHQLVGLGDLSAQ